MKRFLKEWGLLLAFFIVFGLLRLFVWFPVQVDGHSMDPTLADGEHLIVIKTASIEHFDIVVATEGNKHIVKENDLETITKIVERYQQQDTWKENLIFEKDSFELLQDILKSAGELEKRADYEDLVTVEAVEKAMKK